MSINHKDSYLAVRSSPRFLSWDPSFTGNPGLFVDDTCLICSDQSLLVLILNINDDLNRIFFWFEANKLTVNPSKSYAQIIPAKSNETLPFVNLSINNSQISIVYNVKYLGVNIDFKLKFGSYISSIIRKIPRAVGILSKLRYCMPTYAYSKSTTLIFTHTFCMDCVSGAPLIPLT